MSVWRGKTFAEQKETVDFLPSIDDNDHRFLIFDPSDYKANKQMRMTAEAKRILQTDPEERSEQDIYHAQLSLRVIKLIADYPDRMQQKLAKYGRFECYEPGRAVVKEGQPPTGFYFILFGSVIVSVINLKSGASETKCLLNRGESFGELAIMNRTARQSTVITKTYVELLSIDIDTYEKVFMVGGKKNINDPDQTQFIGSLSFLKGWPTKLLWENPDEMIFSYFTRDAVLVRDTAYSKWIVIVKSGSVRMLKKLASRRPTVSARTGRIIRSGPSQLDIRMAFENGGLEKLLWRINNKHIPGCKAGSGCRDEGEDEDDSDSWSLGGSSLRRAQSAVDRLSTRPDSGVLCTGGGEVQRTKTRSARSALAVSARAKTKNAHKRKSRLPVDQEITSREHRTFVDDLNQGYSEHVDTEADRHPVFVHIQTLTKGDTYGVAPLLFPDQPGFCLVSNGADCILLNRDFFLEHCPPKLIRKLKHTMSPYPPEEKLQSDLQTRVNWEVYKTAMVRQTLRRPYPDDRPDRAITS